MDATPIAGFFLGLAGSAHCVAMCGGIASALDRVATGTGWRRLGAHGLYALGRVGSYTILGALVGALGAAASQLVTPERLPEFERVARWGVGGLLIVFAAGLSGFRPLQGLEHLGHTVWRRLQPLARPLKRVPGPLRALGLGALWGFIPCGMIYGALAVATITGSAAEGASFMAAFGLGTVPAVLSIGVFASGLWARLGRQNLRRFSAFAIALCGVWVIAGPVLIRAFQHTQHQH
jgi:sulfite exporter TauE/SafE